MAACSGGEPPATGIAYVGPATINLRGDLELRAPTTATAGHGERLEILETRRRFAKVRTAEGAVGWTDSGDLLTDAQMNDLRRLAARAGELPSLGSATVFDTLNVHTAAARSAPSFAQIEEGDPMEVIGHRVTPRGASTTVMLKTPDRVRSPAADTAEVTDHGVSRPPPATAPEPPPGWATASLPGTAAANGAASRPPSTDDWFLVRLPDGRAGWVLTRMVLMNIPDEVAQYAEGRFIMSYHPLGEVRDEARGTVKNHWLWTTSGLNQPQDDFDSFRVFVYSTRRHRYETAYIERNVRGHYPVETVALADGSQGFAVVTEEKTGQWFKRTFALSAGRVHQVSKIPASPQPPLPEVRAADSFDRVETEARDSGWTRRLRDFGKRWFRR